jgi:hypothetical protein
MRIVLRIALFIIAIYALWYIAIPVILGVCAFWVLTGRSEKIIDILFNSEEE